MTTTSSTDFPLLRTSHGAWDKAAHAPMKDVKEPKPSDVTPSLTIFAIPKPFVGHSAIIQRNAIESWRRLVPTPEIILCGNDAGTAEIAAELNIKHLPNLARNEFGTPFLHSAFEQVTNNSQADRLCYVNADIMLLNDFIDALKRVDVQKFLLVGQRWDLDVNEPWDFESPDWRSRLEQFSQTNGKPHSPWGIDYFVFPKHGVMDRLPPFVVGRPGWDNWVVYNARKNDVPIIDASLMVRAIHQNHDYQHVPMRSGERWVGPEAHRQIQLLCDLMNGNTVRFAIVDATHKLSANGIERLNSLRSLRRRWETLPVLHPRYTLLVRLLSPLVHCADGLWGLRRTVMQWAVQRSTATAACDATR